jgi:hypothetical protein
MKLTSRLTLLTAFLWTNLLLPASSAGQEACRFDIAGVWESTAPGEASPNLYRFAPNGTVTMLSALGTRMEPREMAKAAYKLDNPQAPTTLEFKPATGGRTLPWGVGQWEIVRFGDGAFSVVKAGSAPVTWVRKDPDQYFVVLAAHRGTPPHTGGPAFVMLIRKPEGGGTEVETFGLYYSNGERINGPVPEKLYQELVKNPSPGDDAVLRLQVTAAGFARGMRIVRVWQQRAREGALLFPSYSYLNVIVPLKEVAESLNACAETIHLHKLTWMVDDQIGANFAEWEQPFQYVKKLRELNDLTNVPNATFQQSINSSARASGK